LTRIKADFPTVPKICDEDPRIPGKGEGRKTAMSEQFANRTAAPGRPRVWLALLPALAYVLLTFHASVALASVGQAIPAAAWSPGAAALTTSGVPAPAPPPCCGENQCHTVATAGPLLPAKPEQPPKPRHDVPVAIVPAPAPSFPAVTPGGVAPAQQPHSFPDFPVYLATARLRL